MDCYRCKWRDRPATDEKRRACLGCNPDADNKRGRSFISIDTKGGARLADSIPQTQRVNPLDGILPRCCQETATRLIQFFLDIPQHRRELVFQRLSGMSFAEIARRRHVSRQRIDEIWRELAGKVPGLDSLSSRLP